MEEVDGVWIDEEVPGHGGFDEELENLPLMEDLRAIQDAVQDPLNYVTGNALQAAEWGRRFEAARVSIPPMDLPEAEHPQAGLLRRVLELCAPGRVIRCRLGADDGGRMASSEITLDDGVPLVLYSLGEDDSVAIRNHARQVCSLLGVEYPETEVEAVMSTRVVRGDDPSGMTSARSYGTWGLHTSVQGANVEPPPTELQGFVVGQVVRHKATGEQGVVVGLAATHLIVDTGFVNGHQDRYVKPEAVVVGQVWQGEVRQARSASEL